MELEIPAQLLSVAFFLLNHQMLKKKKTQKNPATQQDMNIKKNCQEEIKSVAAPQRIHEVLEQTL